MKPSEMYFFELVKIVISQSEDMIFSRYSISESQLKRDSKRVFFEIF